MTSLADYFQLVEATFSGDNSRRSASEAQIESLRQTNVNELAGNLINVACALGDSTSVSINQSALLILKQIVKKNWSIGFEEFTGPYPVSPEVKDIIKQKLLELLHVPYRAISSASALILAQIASVEYPEEWPELGDIVLRLLTPENSQDHSVSGGLTLLREMLEYTISEKEFFQMGLDMTERLYLVFTSNNVDVRDKTLAVKCFTLCLMFFEAVEDDAQAKAVEKLAKQIVSRWSEPLQLCLATAIDNGSLDPQQQVFYRALKIECYNLLVQLNSTFRWFNKSYLVPVFLSASWKDLVSAYPQYLNNKVKSSVEETKEAVDLQATLADWIYSILDVLTSALKNYKSGLAGVATSENEVYECIVSLAMIPEDTVESWTEDMNEFVSAEFNDYLTTDIRSQLAYILHKSGIPQDNVIKSLLGLMTNSSDWLLSEAVLFLVEGIYEELEDDSLVEQSISASTIDTLVGIVTRILSTTDSKKPLLISRILLFGGAIAKLVKNQDFELSFVQSAISIADKSSSEDTITKLCTVIFVGNIINLGNASTVTYLQSEQGKLFGWILALSEDAEDETPALLVESLIKIMKISVEASVTQESVVLLLYKLASVDMSNIELTFSVNEALTFLVDSSVTTNHYELLCNNAVPQLLQIVYASKDNRWEYTPQLELALDLISVITEKGPEVLPDAIVQAVLEPIYEVIMTSDEAAILQSASQCVPSLIQKGTEFLRKYTSSTNAQKSGLEMIIEISARLLDPSGDTKEGQSRGLYASKVISATLEHFGSVLTGELLTQIISAASSRLISSENVVLTESFIILFSELFIKSFDTMFEGLWSLDQGKSLAAVLDKWLNSFDVVRGFENINASVLVMSRIAERDDPRLRSITVQGDPILGDDNVILTRSKTRNLKYTQISPAEKIVKLFIKELGSASFEDKLASQVKKAVTVIEDDGDDEDDGNEGEWEDEFDDDEIGHSADSETQMFILSFLQRVQSDPYFVSIFQRLTPEERRILAAKLG